jgi:hypothetical protein
VLDGGVTVVVTTSCGLRAPLPSLLATETTFVFAVVSAKLYVPFPLTSDDTSNEIHVPEANAPDEEVIVGENAGAFA